VKSHLLAHHKAMGALHKRISDSMDDDHEMKAFHEQSAALHEKLCKVLLEPDSRGSLPGVANEGRTHEHEPGPKVRRVFETAAPPSGHRLVPRTGQEEMLKATRVSPQLEDVLGNI
jgi:hypothetical protein